MERLFGQGDDQHPEAVCVKDDGVRWRVFELESCQRHFGITMNGTPMNVTADTIRRCGAKTMIWKLHTEVTPPAVWEHACRTAEALDASGVKHINDPRGWLNCHAKEKAFQVWRREGIPVPDWFEFTNERDFWKNCSFGYPMIIRLNNSTSGAYSWLVHNEEQAKRAIASTIAARNVGHDGSSSTGVGRKFIAVKYINTVRPERVNMSFRIIVAGDKVVVGYARLAQANDWIAITNRFEPWMEAPFVHYQKVCARFCEEHADELVRAVSSLGLNFQGVDVILDQDNKPYYLEVQPGFSVGYADVKSWKPPYYNPSKPESLVQFLMENEDYLWKEVPFYCKYWLNKYNMFDEAYKALRKKLYG